MGDNGGTFGPVSTIDLSFKSENCQFGRFMPGMVGRCRPLAAGQHRLQPTYYCESPELQLANQSSDFYRRRRRSSKRADWYF